MPEFGGPCDTTIPLIEACAAEWLFGVWMCTAHREMRHGKWQRAMHCWALEVVCDYQLAAGHEMETEARRRRGRAY